jgi:anaphase-promoting complex subunit 3
LNKFQKANVLIALERHEEALNVLLDLMNQVPKEAPIHIVIGKIYKKMGNIDRALHHFTKALDLDPKDTNMVKSLIDKIHSNNDINDDADIQGL